MHKLIAILLLAFAPANALAASPEEASQFVDSVGKQVLTTMNGAGDEAAKEQALRDLFAANVDMEWMGKFALGSTWAQANAEQRARYITAYKDYLIAHYTKNFSNYAGSQYTITEAKAAANGEFTVGMNVKTPKARQEEIQAGYRVRSAGGSYKISDIIIEGVSLITTQRSEFGSVAQNGGIDKVTTQLQAKTKA